MTIKDLLRT